MPISEKRYKKWIQSFFQFLPSLFCHAARLETAENDAAYLDQLVEELENSVNHAEQNLNRNSQSSAIERRVLALRSLAKETNLGLACREPEQIIAHCENVLKLIDTVRDDVVNVYLSMSPQQRYHLMKSEKKATIVFEVLGILESEVGNNMKSVLPSSDLEQIKPLLDYSVSRARAERVVCRIAKVMEEMPVQLHKKKSTPMKSVQHEDSQSCSMMSTSGISELMEKSIVYTVQPSPSEPAPQPLESYQFQCVEDSCSLKKSSKSSFQSAHSSSSAQNEDPYKWSDIAELIHNPILK